MKKPDTGIIQRFQAQTLSAYIHRSLSGPQERQCHCLRTRNNTSSFIDLFKTPGKDRAYYKGLQTCGSIHTCPLCAQKITEHRKNEIETILDRTKEKYHYLVTLTFPHTIQDSCRLLRRQFMDARRRLKNWSEVKDHPEFTPFKKILNHHQYDGSVTTVEVTFGQNGWHIHSHELFIFDKPVTDLKKFRDDIFANWTKSCLYSGIEINKPLAFYRRSVQVDALYGDHLTRMTSYLSKIQSSDTWGPAAEMTKGIMKKSDNQNLTPFGMLYEIINSKNKSTKTLNYKKYAPLFWEFCQTFKGKQMIRFSKGLKSKYDIEEKTDEECVNPESIIDTWFGWFDPVGEWPVIKKLRLRGWIIENSNTDWNTLAKKLNNEIKTRMACNDRKQALLEKIG